MSVARAARIRDQDRLSTVEIRQLPWEEVAGEFGIVLLVGGLSRMPVIGDRMRSLFPKADVVLLPAPQEAVVRGLAFSERYQRLNLHRPPFSFYLSWFDASRQQIGAEQLVYPAFTPLYRAGDPLRKLTLSFQPSSMPVAPREARVALLHARTVDGDDMVLDVDGEELRGVPVAVGGGMPCNFTLYVTGDIAVGQGTTRGLRVRSWPTLRGSRFNWLEMYTTPDTGTPYLDIDEWRFNH
jgi:hypothetical protein